MGSGKKRAKAAADEYAWAGPDGAEYTPEQQVELARLREALDGRLWGKRLAHSLRVAATVRRMACRYGVDPYLAEAAGLLHDWDKKLPVEELWAKARELGVLPGGADPRMEPLLHAWTAGASLPAQFPELPPEVFRAVSRHTVGAADMSPLDMVVYIADAVEPGRDYESAERLRRRVADGEDLGALYALMVREGIASLLERGRYIDPAALVAWNALV